MLPGFLTESTDGAYCYPVNYQALRSEELPENKPYPPYLSRHMVDVQPIYCLWRFLSGICAILSPDH